MDLDRQHSRRGLTASRVVDLCLLGALLAVLALAWIGGDQRPVSSVEEAARVAVQRQLGVQSTAGREQRRAVANADAAVD
jgi:hypothetical protein